MNLWGGVLVFRLAGLVGLASGIQFCDETQVGLGFHLSKAPRHLLFFVDVTDHGTISGPL